jgi:methylenetetrahydrofolate reductase (NADPH)
MVQGGEAVPLQTGLSGEAPAAILVDLLNHASIEIAAGSSRALAALHDQFDPGTDVFVNFIPGGDWRVVADTAAALRRGGFHPVPHIAARSIPDAPVLADFLARLSGEAAVDRVLLIAGDGAAPAGPYASSLDIIATGLLEQNGVRSVGVAGHPEGHPSIDSATLDAALLVKRDAAARAGLDLFIVTQFCFEAAPILGWLARIRLAGIAAPVRVGVAGPATVATLVRFGMRCGIGNSLRAVRMRPNAVGRLLGKSGPEDLFADLGAGLAAMPGHGVGGIHFFPFGGIADTGAFVARTLERLYRDVGRAADQVP